MQSTKPVNPQDELIYDLRLDYLYDQLHVSLIGSLLCYVIANSIIWSYTSSGEILFWASLLTGIYALREITYIYYKRSRHTDSFNNRTWFVFFILGALASSITWSGAWLFIFFNPQEFETSTLILVLLTGMTLTAIWSYSCFISVFSSFACPLLLAIFFTLITSEAEYAGAIAVMMFVFAGFLMIFALRANSNTLQLFNLQVSNTRLENEKHSELDKKIHAEKALQHSQILWQQIVETAKDIIIRADNSGKILYVNNIAEQLTGYPKSEIIGTPFHELVRPDYRQKVRRFYMKQYLNKAESAYLEVPVVKKDRDIIWLAQNMQTVMINNEIVEFQAVARDITAAKKSEKALVEAKEKAEEARRIEEEFLTNISHEMRTPLNAIVGLTNLLTNTKLSDEQEEFTSALQSSSEQLLTVINDLLDLSKIEKGFIEFIKAQINIEDFINSLRSRFYLMAREKGLTLTIRSNENIPPVIVGDKNRLLQILINLVSNAIKFTEQGHVDVYLEIESETDEEIRLLITVEDTGIGIEEHALESIFEDFRQAHIKSHLSFSGTGLGLSIVKKLVELQGGNINVRSVSGEGSAFSFELGFDKYNPELEYTDPDNSYDIPEITDNKTRLNILIADDNELNRLVTSRHLLRFWKNIDVDQAAHGREAVEKVKHKTYDVILMDLQMPIMNGYEASEYIRKSLPPDKAKTPIIALTAGLVPMDRIQNTGINDYLPKPFKPADLLEKILALTNIEAEQQADMNMKKQTGSPSFEFIDYDGLLDRTDGDKQIMLAMIDLYLENTPQAISNMRGFCDKPDWDRLASEAHSFKPTPVYFGFELAHENTIRIEGIAKQEGDVDDVIELIQEIENNSIYTTEELIQLKNFLSSQATHSA